MFLQFSLGLKWKNNYFTDIHDADEERARVCSGLIYRWHKLGRSISSLQKFFDEIILKSWRNYLKLCPKGTSAKPNTAHLPTRGWAPGLKAGILRGAMKAVAVLCCQSTPNQPPQLQEWDPSLGDAHFSFLSTPPQCTTTEGGEK